MTVWVTWLSDGHPYVVGLFASAECAARSLNSSIADKITEIVLPCADFKRALDAQAEQPEDDGA